MAGLLATGPASPSTVNVQSKGTFTTTGAVVGTTETTIVVPTGTRAFKLQASDSAGAAVLTISNVITGTSSEITSFDIYAGSSWSEETLNGLVALTLYIKSSKSGTNVQLMYWI